MKLNSVRRNRHTYLIAVDDILVKQNGDTSEVSKYDDSDVSNNNFFVFTVSSNETITREIQTFIYEVTPNAEQSYDNIPFASQVTSAYRLSDDLSSNDVDNHTLYALDTSNAWTKYYDSTLSNTSDLSFQAFQPYIIYMSNVLTLNSDTNRLLRVCYGYNGTLLQNITLNNEDSFAKSIKNIYSNRYNIAVDLINVIVVGDTNSVILNVIINSSTIEEVVKSSIISSIQNEFTFIGNNIRNIISQQLNLIRIEKNLYYSCIW